MQPEVKTLLLDALQNFHTVNKKYFHEYLHNDRVPEHKYQEAYFHAHFGHNSMSIDPRSLSQNIEKKCAPLELCAFIDAFKQVNKLNLQTLIKGTQLEKMNLFSNLFTDLSYQVHSMADINKRNIMWHKDSHNSMLHLSISVQNKRLLHFTKNNKTYTQWQQPGDVYIATPNIMNHGVQYPQTSANNPIIAIQCRTELTYTQLVTLEKNKIQTIQETRQMCKLAQNMKLKLPALKNIETAMQQFSNINNQKNVTNETHAFLGRFKDQHHCNVCAFKCYSNRLFSKHVQSHNSV